MSGKVLVTGASGFIAAHVIKQLTEQGYSIVGTVRSDAKGEFLVKQYPGLKYEIVKNISELNAFDHVFQAHPDIKYVLHMASPFFFGSDPYNDLILPAINGTLSALQGALKYGSNVEKVVITSSFAAMSNHATNLNDPSVTYTEESWNPITMEQGKTDSFYGYYASKTFAEKAAWDFLKEEKPSFKITTVQVPWVLGPPINDIGLKNLNTSNSLIYGTYNLSKTDEISSTSGFSIDVRDAAKTHIIAMTESGLDNKRCLSSEGPFDTERIVEAIGKISPELKAKLPTVAPFDPSNFSKIDNSVSRKYLKFEYIPFETTVADTVARLQELQKEESA